MSAVDVDAIVFVLYQLPGVVSSVVFGESRRREREREREGEERGSREREEEVVSQSVFGMILICYCFVFFVSGFACRLSKTLFFLSHVG